MRRLIAVPLVVAAALAVAPVALTTAHASPLPICFYSQEFGRTCIPS